MTTLAPHEISGPRESLRCLRCSSRNMHRSGREPYRVICGDCGSHYHVVMQLIPVEPSGARPESSLEADVGSSTRTT